MVIDKGDKVHIVYRALYDNSTRRHFLGEVLATEGAVCRVEGYAFVYDRKTTMFEKKPDKRTTILDLGESGYVVNVIESNVDLDSVCYDYLRDVGLVATDGKAFLLNINEFGSKS
ncbi:MAG: hypothetical protein WBO47_09165 [Gammaproteobacteria bacterium]